MSSNITVIKNYSATAPRPQAAEEPNLESTPAFPLISAHGKSGMKQGASAKITASAVRAGLGKPPGAFCSVKGLHVSVDGVPEDLKECLARVKATASSISASSPEAVAVEKSVCDEVE